ncbi:MAG TPA: urea transporter [Cyclobacteriaceae bacterium]
MEHQSYIISPADGWIIIAGLSVLWIGLGYYWGRRAKSMDGYMLAGRKVGLALGTATVMATWVTSNTTMLAPQFALELGIWGMIAYSTAALGLLLFAPLAARIRALMPGGYTSGDFIRLRYGKAAWILFLLISIFYGFIWMISMGMAGGILMNAIAGIPYEIGMSVILFVCVAYTLFGGLYAVIGTDYIQSLLILIGVVIIGISVFQIVDFSEIYSDLRTDKPMLINALLPASIMAVFNNLLFGVGEVFHSNVWWSRVFAMTETAGRRAYLIGGLIWLPVPVAAGFIALASGSLGINITRPDMVGPLVAASVLGEAGSIVVFMVFFCSLASSLDSLLASTSDLITQDIYKKMINPGASDARLRKVSSRIVLALGFVAWLVCLPRIGTLADVLFFAGPLVASTIWPIATGLFWRKANTRGAIAGMIAGSVIGMIFYFMVGWYSASLVGAATSMIVVVLFTHLFPGKFEWHKLDENNALKKA